jgi:hypothetical protein
MGDKDDLARIILVLAAEGDWAHGGRVEEVAAEWECAFSPGEVQKWLAAGCCWPEAAAYAWDKGVLPAEWGEAATRFGYAGESAEQAVAVVDRMLEEEG